MNMVDELKMVLRAMLISSTTGLTKNEIYRNYQDMEGRQLPYRELGFSSAEDLFRNLGDVMQVRYVKGVPVYVAVDVPETAHLTRMISKQKTNKKSRRPAMRAVPASQGGRSTLRHMRTIPASIPSAQRTTGVTPLANIRTSFTGPSSFASSGSCTDWSSFPSQPARAGQSSFANAAAYPGAPPRTSAPAFSNVVPRFPSTPPRTSAPSFSSASVAPPRSNGPSFANVASFSNVASQQDQNIPRLKPPSPPSSNFTSDFLRPMQQDVGPKPHNGPAVRVVPASIQNNIRILLEGERDGIMGSVLVSLYQKRFGSQLDYRSYDYATLLDMLKAISDVAHIEYRSPGIYRVYSILHGKYVKAQDVTMRPARPPPQTALAEIPERRKNKSRRSVESDPTVPEEIKENVRKLLTNYSAGLQACFVLRDYKLAYNTELNLAKLGYSSVVELMAAIPSVVTIERPERSGDWLLFDAQSHPPTASSNPEIPQVRNNWRQELKSLIDSYPAGVYLSELQDIFKMVYGENLDPPLLGYSNLFDMMMELRGDLVESVDYVSAEKILIRPLVNKTTEPSRAPADRGPAIARPDDLVLPGTRYKPQPIPEEIRKGDGWFGCLVSHVHHPGQLSIQLVLESSGEPEVEGLMDKLEDLYKGPEGDLYVIPDDQLVLNMVCAAIFHDGGDYHRCVLTRINDDRVTLEVYYVDYGGTAYINKKHIRYLRKDFMALPAQAIDAKLHGINMANGRYWSRSSKDALLKLVRERKLLASLRSFKEKERVMQICLCDTQGAEDLHINDRLVELGHAVYDDGQGETGDEVEAIGADAGGDTDGCSSTGSERTRRYVRRVDLTKLYSAHLINLDSKVYISAPEIAAFLWEHHQLHLMLRQKKVVISDKLTVSREDHEELFEEFDRLKIKDLVGKECTTIYAVSTIPKILREFRHPDESLVKKLIEVEKSFDPRDPYWSNEGEEQESFEEIIENVNLSDLRMRLKVLQYKRQDYLRRMSEEVNFTGVDDLKEVEILMSSVSKKIQSLEEKGHTSDLALTENEKYTVDCVRGQYDDSPDKSTVEAKSPTESLTTSLSNLTTSVTSPSDKSVNRVAPMPKDDVNVTSSSSATTSLVEESTVRQVCDQAYHATANNLLYNNPQVLVGQRRMAQTMAQFAYQQPNLSCMPNLPYQAPLQIAPPGTYQYQGQYPSPTYNTFQWTANGYYSRPAQVPSYQAQAAGPYSTHYYQSNTSGLPMNWPPQPR